MNLKTAPLSFNVAGLDYPCRYSAQKWRSSPRPQRGWCTHWLSGWCGSGAPGQGWPGAEADTGGRWHDVTDHCWYLLITQMWGAGVDKVGKNQEERIADSLLVGKIIVRHMNFKIQTLPRILVDLWSLASDLARPSSWTESGCILNYL